LYRTGMNAEFTGQPAESFTQSGGPGHAPYFDQWDQLAQHLAQLPAEVETILVVLLPKVGAVANLQPKGIDRQHGYAETYQPGFSISASILAGDRLRAVDEAIQQANATIQGKLTAAATAAGTADRLEFLDVFALFDSRDYKNSRDASRRIAVDP